MKKLVYVALPVLLAAACQRHQVPATTSTTASPARRVVLTGVDASKKPGDDFFMYANGIWNDTARIPDSQAGVGSYSFLNYPQRIKLQAILDSVSAGPFRAGSIEQQVGDFYASGMDTVAINQRGYTPIKPLLARIDALADVPAALTIDLIHARAITTAKGMQKNFGIARPRLAVAGLNPHAGENGALGREEIEIIRPAIEQLRAEGIDIVGPLAADGMFHARARETYDVALCMYHDQALIPIKTLNFDDGVNITLGLPIVRTSPDHGTAFGIAGTDSANPGAMIAAIRMAEAAARARIAYG